MIPFPDFDRRIVTAVVGREDAGATAPRLDRWLAGRFTYRSRNQWQDCVAKGLIRVNGHPARSSRALRPGDTVEFIADGFDEPTVDLSYRILWEDDHLVAVDKSGNLPCHPAGPFFRNTLWHRLSTDLGRELFLINRLDRETSGVALFAKNEDVAKLMSKMHVCGTVDFSPRWSSGSGGEPEDAPRGGLHLRTEGCSTLATPHAAPPPVKHGASCGRADFPVRPEVGRVRKPALRFLACLNPLAADGCAEQLQIKKEYIVIVHGAFPESVETEGWLIGDTASTIRKKRRFVMRDEAERVGVSNRPEAETSVTHLRLITTHGGLSAVRAVLGTGRTHQIRATLFSLGFPVVGDKIYGVDDTVYLRFIDGTMTAEDNERMILTRQALHAERMTFTHPVDGSRVELKAPLPEDMARIL